MLKADCRLTLDTPVEGGHVHLRFTQPVFGVKTKICTITKKIGEPVLSTTGGKPLDSFNRFVFRFVSGLRDYQELASVTGDSPPKARISFYRCTDRKGRERHFVYASDPASDTGGAFVAHPEDFQKVMEQLANIEVIHGAGKAAL